jgi:hypothetical protein
MTKLLAKVVNRDGGPIGNANVEFFLNNVALGKCRTSSSGVCHIDVEDTADAITVKASVEGLTKIATVDPETQTYVVRFTEIIPPSPSFFERHFPALSGIAFLLIAIGLTFIFPEATPFQQRIIRATFALAGGGFAAEIPGFLDIQLTVRQKMSIQAGGALAVFVILFFFEPR